MNCKVRGGPLERSEQYPEAGWLHVNDSDDTHAPELPGSEVTASACEQTVAGGRCTMCEADSYELLPWSGERICWDCFDHQLDLMAKAIQEAGTEEFLVFGADVPEPFEAVEA